MIDVLLLIVILLCFIVTLSMVAHIWSGVPYVPTRTDVARAMVQAAALKQDMIVYDLGCGDARILIEAKRRCPGIKAIGYEIIPTVWLYGKLRALFQHQDVSLQWGNIFRKDLSNADVVYLYLYPEVLKKLVPKFTKELRPGTTVVSHAFTFEDKKYEKKIEVSAKGKSKNIYVYKW